MTTVDSWPKTLPMTSVGSWNSTTETHLIFITDCGKADDQRGGQSNLLGTRTTGVATSNNLVSFLITYNSTNLFVISKNELSNSPILQFTNLKCCKISLK